MKTAKWVVLSIGICALAWLGLTHHTEKAGVSTKTIKGTKFELVARHGAFELYIDKTLTNGIEDFAVFQGNDCIVLREHGSSNTVETTYFENGFNVLLTRRDKKNKILNRIFNYDDDSGTSQYVYVDKNGDGLWDVFLDYTNQRFYFSSNLCWVSGPLESDDKLK